MCTVLRTVAVGGYITCVGATRAGAPERTVKIEFRGAAHTKSSKPLSISVAVVVVVVGKSRACSGAAAAQVPAFNVIDWHRFTHVTFSFSDGDGATDKKKNKKLHRKVKKKKVRACPGGLRWYFRIEDGRLSCQRLDDDSQDGSANFSGDGGSSRRMIVQQHRKSSHSSCNCPCHHHCTTKCPGTSPPLSLSLCL